MGLKKKTLHGLAWAFSSQMGKVGSQFVITAVLARLLSPRDFGLLGMATVFTNFAIYFGDLGVGSALIQKQDVDERHLSSAFWLNIMAGVALTLVFIAIAPLIAKFYGRPELTLIVRVLSFSYVLSSFTIVQQAILTKDMDFKKLTARDMGAVIIAGIAGIACAYKGLGVWSLVFQLLTYFAINGIVLWTLSSWRPKFIFSLAAIKDILRFSANMTGSNVMYYFGRNVDTLLVGRFLGPGPLGYYTLACKLMLVPLQNISWVIGKVMFPAFSRIQNEVEKVRSAYLKIIKAVAIVTFPMMFCLLAVAPEFIKVFFGPKWGPVIFVIRILSVVGAFQSLAALNGTIFMSLGKPDVRFKMAILETATVTVAILLGLRWGINGVAVCYAVQSILFMQITLYVVRRMIYLRSGTFYRGLINPLLISGFVCSIVFLIKNIMPMVSDKFTLSISLLVSVVAYSVFLIVTKEVVLKNGKLHLPLISGSGT